MHTIEPGGSKDYAENLEPFISQIPDYALYMLDLSGHIISWNAGAERLKGYSAQEIMGRHFSIFYLTEDVAMDKPHWTLDYASRKKTYQEEGLRVRKDGTVFWAAATITALRDRKGDPCGFARLTYDITDRKAYEAALQAAREGKYRALFENSYDAIFLTRPKDGAVLAANPAACALFGYSGQELLAMCREELVDVSDPRFAEAWAERAAVGAATAKFTLIRKGGARFEARISSKLFTDESGEQVACTSVHDTTGEDQVEEALRQSEERFRLLFENAPIGILQTDQNARLAAVNRKFTEITGYPPEDIIGLPYSDTAIAEEKSFIEEMSRKLRSGEVETFTHERRMPHKDGSTIWVRLHARLMPDKEGRLREGLVLFEDITERKQAEEALRQSEEKFRATFEHAPLGIAECAVDGRFIQANSKLADILGYAKDELAHLTMRDVTHPGDLEESLANLQKLSTGEAHAYVMEKRYIRKDRSLVWVNVTASISPIPGKSQYLVVTVEDITARKKVAEDVKRAIESSYQQANHDMLTGLANRAAFTDRLKAALSYAERDGHLVAIHLLDLDSFKLINDTLGHHVGDLLLEDAAKRIKSQVRATDLAARLGGDEFVVIQTHLAEPVAAGILAGKLVEELGRTYVLEGQEVHSGTSIGIALYPEDARAPEELMKHADLALYDAKDRGRFNYQFYRKELGIAFQKAQQLEQELIRALRRNEFRLHYQPQFGLRSERITGIEALLRWQHPAKGTLPAAAFLQDAERARLMPAIGEWTLHTACRQYKAWTDAGLAVPLSLNLSSLQLLDPRFLQMLNSILDETGLPAHLLQLEMRENALWDPKLSKSLLKQMKESGLRLALDDYCTDMTALSTLDKFPLDAVKPGQAFMRALPGHEREATVLSAIIGVAHNLKITVCADGIETTGQLAAVKERGCDSVQGNLLSPPLDADAMKRLIDVELAH